MNSLTRTAAAALFTLAAGAAGTPQAAAQTTLSFPSWQAEDPVFAPWWKDLIAEYEAQHPGVKINFSSIPFNQYINQMTVRFAGNNPPDIVHLPSRNFGSFAEKNWLAPLDEYLKDTDILQSWTPLQEGMVWDGKQQGVLLLGFGYMLYYNKPLIEAAGVAVPKTVDELIAGARKITDKDKGVFGFLTVTTEHPNLVPEASDFVIGAGLDFFKLGKYDMADPKVVAAIDQYRELVRQAPPGLNSTVVAQIFRDGKGAFRIDGPFLYPSLKANADAFGVARLPFPKVPGGMSNSLHIAAKTDPEKKKLVFDFIKLAASPKWQERYSIATSSPAPRKGSLTEAALKANPVLETMNASAAEAVDVFPSNGAVRAKYNEFANMFQKAVMRLQVTSDPTAAVLKDLQTELEKRIPLQ